MNLEQKYSKLKESFDYNLSIIYERDKELEDFESRLESATATISQRDDSIMALKKQIGINKSIYEEKESNFLCKISSLTSEITDLKYSLNNLHSDNLNQISSLEQVKKDQNVLIDAKQKECDDIMQKEIQQYIDKIDKIKEIHSNELEEYKLKQESNNQQIKALEEILKEYKSEINNKDKQINSIKNDFIKFKDETFLENNKYTFEIDKLNNKIQQHIDQISNKEISIQSLNEQINLIKKEYQDNINYNKQSNEDRIQSLKAEVETEIQDIVNNHKIEIVNLKTQIMEGNNIIQVKTEELNSLKNIQSSNTRQYDNKISILTNELEMNQKEYNNYKNNMENRLEQLLNENNNYLNTINLLKKNNKELLNTNDQILLKENELIEKYENALNQNKNKSIEDLNELRHKLDAAIKDKIDINETLLDTRIELKNVSDKFKDLNTKLLEMTKNYENNVKMLDNYKRELNKQNNNYNKSLNNNKSLISNSNNKQNTTKLEDLLDFGDIEDKLDNSNLYNNNVNNNQSNDEYFNLKNENEELKQVVEDMTSMIDKLQNEITVFKEKNLYENAMNKDSLVLDLKHQITVFERDYDMVKNECGKYIAEIDSLNDKIKELNDALIQKDYKIMSIQKQRDKLETINYNIKKQNKQFMRDLKVQDTYEPNITEENVIEVDQEHNQLVQSPVDTIHLSTINKNNTNMNKDIDMWADIHTDRFIDENNEIINNEIVASTKFNKYDTNLAIQGNKKQIEQMSHIPNSNKYTDSQINSRQRIKEMKQANIKTTKPTNNTKDKRLLAWIKEKDEDNV